MSRIQNAITCLGYICLTLAVGRSHALAQTLRQPSYLTGAYSGHGLETFIGTITELHGQPPTSVTISISEYLAGVKVPDNQIDVDVDYAGGHWARREPLWLHVHPVLGEKILVTLSGFPNYYTQCVLDLDSQDVQWLPLIRQILDADQSPPDERTRKLTELLKDPSPAARHFAESRLRSHPMAAADLEREKAFPLRDSEKAFDQAYAAARTGATAQRLEAIRSLARNVYGPHDDINRHVIVVLGQLAGDPDTAVRQQALSYLYEKAFAQGDETYAMSLFTKDRKDQLIRALKKDVNEQPANADRSGQLLCILEPKADSRCMPKGFNNQPPKRGSAVLAPN